LFIRQVNFIKAYEKFAIGDLSIKPYPMDHSAPDSMAFLINDSKNRIFYTGDFRGHGRKEKCFQHLLNKPPRDIDLLIIEGTMLGRDTDTISNESSVETKMAKCLKNHPDLPFFLSTSPQNVDRMVSCYRAATKSKRILVLDIYSAWILRQLQILSKNIPDLSWDKIRVIANGETASRHYGIMKSNPDFFKEFIRELYEKGNVLSLEELQALITAIKPAKTVSLHTEHTEMLSSLTSKVQMVDSGCEINLKKLEAKMSYDDFKCCVKKEFCEKLCSSKKTCCLDRLKFITGENHPSTPGMLKCDIVKTKEQAMQRAILGLENKGKICPFAKKILEKSKKYKERTISWIDMELPVFFSEDSRRYCLDLLGISDDQPVICELKFVSASSKDSKITNWSDCPIYAAMELFNYHLSILANHKELYTQNIRHQFENTHPNDPGGKIWEKYDKGKPILLVAANKEYWEYWNEKRTNKKAHKKGICSLETFEKISKKIGVKILPYSFEDMFFELEKNGKHCPGKRHREVSKWKLID
ncbi:MAG: hypothetical protein KAS17_01830, partial [Victivallaceae bacterium]|nr:hypothetical protein [Victivallaceae bacterium]